VFPQLIFPKQEELEETPRKNNRLNKLLGVMFVSFVVQIVLRVETDLHGFFCDFRLNLPKRRRNRKE